MAGGSKGSSALAALRKGAVVVDDSGESPNAGPKTVGETQPKVVQDRPSNSGGNGPANGTGNGPASKPAAPAAASAFGARTAASEPAAPAATRPTTGTLPHGKTVEIDWTQDGAGPEAPYGRLSNGKIRTRKPKAKTGTARKATSSENLTGLTKALMGLHMMGAEFTKQPHWELSEKEAQEIGRATAQLQAQYGIDVDPKMQAWINFAAVIGMAYGPRVSASYAIARGRRLLPAATPTTDAKGSPEKEQPKRPLKEAPKPAGKAEILTPSQLTLASGGSFDDTTG